LPVRTGIRPAAGSARVLASQVSPCPGLARQWPRPRERGGRSGRTGLDAAASPDPCGARDAGPRGTTRYGCRLGGRMPAQLALATAGPAEAAGGCSRRPERRGWVRQPLGKPLTPDGPRRRWPTVQVTKTCRCRSPRVWSHAGVLVTCLCRRAAGSAAGGGAPSAAGAIGGRARRAAHGA
jgi:hypothetical protein